MKKKKDNTLLEMLVGIIIWGILSQVVLGIFFGNYLYNAIGLWCGIVVAGGMAIHMKRSIEDAYDLQVDIGKQIRADSMKRMLVAAIVIGTVFYFEAGNPLTVLVGIFSLKISAYAQPYMHKIFSKGG